MKKAKQTTQDQITRTAQRFIQDGNSVIIFGLAFMSAAIVCHYIFNADAPVKGIALMGTIIAYVGLAINILALEKRSMYARVAYIIALPFIVLFIAALYSQTKV